MRRHHEPTRYATDAMALPPVAVIVLSTLALAMSAVVASSEERQAERPGATASEPAEVEPGQLVAAPESYVGRTVRVRAEIDETIGPRAFLLGTPASRYDERHDAPVDPNLDAKRDARVLVLLEEGDAVPGEAGTDVVVRGEVRRPSRQALERDHPWLTFTPEVELTAGHGRPVILAESVVPQARPPE